LRLVTHVVSRRGGALEALSYGSSSNVMEMTQAIGVALSADADSNPIMQQGHSHGFGHVSATVLMVVVIYSCGRMFNVYLHFIS